jgi:hypothetical protein
MRRKRFMKTVSFGNEAAALLRIMRGLKATLAVSYGRSEKGMAGIFRLAPSPWR